MSGRDIALKAVRAASPPRCDGLSRLIGQITRPPARPAHKRVTDLGRELGASQLSMSVPRAGTSGIERGTGDGIPAAGQFGPQGLGADDGHDDVRRQGKLRQGRQRPARRRAQAHRHRRRRRRQSHRHRQCLFRRRLRGADRRGDGRKAQARHADRDQGALSDGRGPERSRPVALASDPRLRSEPQAAAH